jgi:hypothetical protein
MPQRILAWFDVKSAIIGALLMGTLIGLINSGHGLTPALTAAAKQGAYTFFFAGLIMQYCRWLSARKLEKHFAIALATIWPTIITIVLVYTLHSFKGTPEPVLSSIPPGVIGMISFFLVSRKLLQENPET